MNNASLEFFKSLVERDTKVMEMLLKDNTAPSGPTSSNTAMFNSNIYSNIKFVNDVLTIILKDGDIISKHPATIEDFNRARDARSEIELFTICSSKEGLEEKRKFEEEIKRNAAILEGCKKLAKLTDFDLRDGSIYMAGINRSLPPLMVEEFASIVGRRNPLEPLSDNEEYEALKRFWMWCCLNPRAEVAEKLFEFLKKNIFKITKQGFFAALRNVVTIHGGTELVQFVSETYNKVKAVWKKNPEKYVVFLEDGEYKLVHVDDMYDDEWVECEYCYGDPVPEEDQEDCECPTCGGEGGYDDIVRKENGELIGGLTDLYLDLPNRAENRFTDAHTGTFDIRVGKVVEMPMDQCRWNTDDCGAAGLHFTSDEIHYVGCGDQSVLVLINPMKVVGIGESKGRCYEYLPIMTVPREEATSLLHDLDFDTLELDDAYAINELDGLADKVKAGFAAEAKKHAVNFPTISMNDVRDIVNSLNKMKAVIGDRVKSI
jgi:hypothetical protein